MTCAGGPGSAMGEAVEPRTSKDVISVMGNFMVATASGLLVLGVEVEGRRKQTKNKAGFHHGLSTR